MCSVRAARVALQVARGGLGEADSSLVQRVLGLLAGPLLKWELLTSSSYAEWVGFKVSLALRHAVSNLLYYLLQMRYYLW